MDNKPSNQKTLPEVFTRAEKPKKLSKISMFRSEKRRANHEKGALSEDIAVLYLKSQGYRILSRNFRFHKNEIDIIAQDGKYLTFIEVKARKNPKHGFGYEAVNLNKQRCIRKVAEAYLIMNHMSLSDTPCRFDVISIDSKDISLFKNAF